jgi:hypothetical protein
MDDNFSWLDDAIAHINKNVGVNDRIFNVSGNYPFGCVSISVLMNDDVYPNKIIQYCPPMKDLDVAAALIRGALVK